MSNYINRWRPAILTVLVLAFLALLFAASRVYGERKQITGTWESCVYRRPEEKRPAEIRLTGLIRPHGVGVRNSPNGVEEILIADGPRPQPIRIPLVPPQVSRDIDACAGDSCSGVDLRGLSVLGSDVGWMRHDLNRMEPGGGDANPLLPGPSGVCLLAKGSYLATCDVPADHGSLVMVRDGKVQVLDRDLKNPTGIAVTDDHRVVYVVESAPEYTLWRSYYFDETKGEARRRSVLGMVRRKGAGDRGFEGFAVAGACGYAAASDGLYVFEGPTLRGRLALDEGVGGVALSREGIVFTSGHRVLLLPANPGGC